MRSVLCLWNAAFRGNCSKWGVLGSGNCYLVGSQSQDLKGPIPITMLSATTLTITTTLAVTMTSCIQRGIILGFLVLLIVGLIVVCLVLTMSLFGSCDSRRLKSIDSFLVLL